MRPRSELLYPLWRKIKEDVREINGKMQKRVHREAAKANESNASPEEDECVKHEKYEREGSAGASKINDEGY